MIKFLATGCYLGLIPKAPGTFGTLLGIPLSYLFLSLGEYAYYIATLIFIFLSIVIAELHDRTLEEDDSGTIVIDEIAGYLVAFAALPFQVFWIIAAFVLFRFFDAVKPFPINRLDRIKGGIGIVLDDLGAGLITNIILQILLWQIG